MARQITLLSLLVATVLLASSLMAALIPLAGAQSSVLGANWEAVNYSPQGGSYNPQTQITKDNVQYLETKWVYPYTQPSSTGKIGKGFGAYSPVSVVDGVAYV